MLNRRMFQCAMLAAALAAPALASAQVTAYPSQAVRFVVPYAAGGIADMLARVVAEKLTARGYSIVIDNRPGQGGHTGGDYVAKAPADGYTIMLGTIAHNGATQLFKNLRYDPVNDLQPVIQIAESPSVLLVNQAVPAKSVSELLALVRARPGQVTYGSAGNGSAMHMAAELFKHMAQVDVIHVPYRGGAPAMTDLLGGQINMLFESVGTAHQHIQGGKLRVLAVTSTTRNPSLPQVPTMAEAGVPGYAAVPWYTISVAKAVPPAIVAKLNADINTALRSPDLVRRWEAQGVLPLGGTRDTALKRNVVETKRWSAVIAAAKMQPD